MTIVESAAKHVLSEKLGFDEARIYYLMLLGQEEEIAKNFSYSKKYRILKLLFEKGALSKIKPEGRDFYSYFLLPPLFIDGNSEIKDYLSELYKKNFEENFNHKFFQIIMKVPFEGFVKFLKNAYIDTMNKKINFEFNKIRCLSGD